MVCGAVEGKGATGKEPGVLGSCEAPGELSRAGMGMDQLWAAQNIKRRTMLARARWWPTRVMLATVSGRPGVFWLDRACLGARLGLVGSRCA